ncbi:MAG: gluconokinase [Pyrinomonadaceae bacterium]
MLQKIILGIDIGSSSVRAGLYDYVEKPLKGLVVRREWSFASTPDGGSQMAPTRAFDDVCDVIDDLLARSAGQEVEITHLAMCSFWHSLMGVDPRGKPTTPVLGWADTRSGKYSAELKRRFDEHEVHNRTGAHFHSSFWPSKLLWIKRERPDVFVSTDKWMGFGDYVIMRLVGASVTSTSMASATGIFDQRKLDWDKDLLRFLRVRSADLPQIAETPVKYKLTSAFARRWSALRKASILPAIGDGAADHVGSCGIGKNKASLMVGTSAAIRIAYRGDPPKEIPRGLWCYRIDADHVILGGALSDGGNLYEWCRRNFGLPTDAEEEIRRRDPGRALPIVLPYFHGERSIGYREDARGEILNLRPSHDVIDILHAAMIAVVERLAGIYEQLRGLATIDGVVASGGALRSSPLWCEILAKALGRELELSPADESALQGVVRLTLDGLSKE